jgi:hypothetical protein
MRQDFDDENSRGRREGMFRTVSIIIAIVSSASSFLPFHKKKTRDGLPLLTRDAGCSPQTAMSEAGIRLLLVVAVFESAKSSHWPVLVLLLQLTSMIFTLMSCSATMGQENDDAADGHDSRSGDGLLCNAGCYSRFTRTLVIVCVERWAFLRTKRMECCSC